MYGICGFSTASGSLQSSPSATQFSAASLTDAPTAATDVFFLREENCKLTAQQKQTLARVNALFSGILLTSDMPSRYTDEMRRQYNALRELTDHAENCTVDADDGLTVHYTLHGKQQAIKVF